MQIEARFQERASKLKMATLRLIFKVVRYWRCYSLLLIASVLSLFLIYASQHDPNMEYFGLGLKYLKEFSNIGADDVKKLLETNKLDYEFLNSNARFCYHSQQQQQQQPQQQQKNDPTDVNDYDLLDDYNQDPSETGSKYAEIILISISQSVNFKHRSAARQTWGKRLGGVNGKLLFVIGNALYESRDNKSRETDTNQPLATFDLKDKAKLDKEMSTHSDIIQINMPDDEPYMSTKVLMAIRWSFTYCLPTKYLFILSDTAVLNVDQFEKLLKKSNQSTLRQEMEREAIAGVCNLKDETFSSALKFFYKDIYKKQQEQQLQKKMQTTTASRQLTLNNKSGRWNTGEENGGSAARKPMVLNDYNGEYCSNSGG